MPAMSQLLPKDKSNDVDFKWGIKRGRGGLKKDVQFYESFTYDGVEYFLYDSVYLFKDGEPDPYIGKLIKIWELANKSKKVKVLWFFHPSEISSYLGDLKILENELFLASGDGVGLANINPLEAIAGKCNVVCISKDKRNRQPSEKELKMADHIFYRTFDVMNCTISDKLGEKIATVEVKLLLNKSDPQLYCPLKINFNLKGNSENGVVSAQQELVSPKSAAGSAAEPGVHSDFLPGETPALKASVNTQEQCFAAAADGEALLETAGLKLTEAKKVNNYAFDAGGAVGTALQIAKHGNAVDFPNRKCKNNVQEQDVGAGINGAKEISAALVAADEKVRPELPKPSCPSADAAGKVRSANDHQALDGRPLKKLKRDDSIASNLKKLSSCAIVPSDTSKLEHAKDSERAIEQTGKRKPANETAFSDSRTSKITEPDDRERSNTRNLASDSDGDNVEALQSAAPATDNKLKGTSTMDSYGPIGSLSKMLKNDKMARFPNDKLGKASLKHISKKGAKVYGRVVKVTRRPIDSSRWFTGLPWEERVKAAHAESTLVLLQNLDPAYSSSDVEDIVWHGFRENCTAKVIPCTIASTPPFGQAFIIMRTKDAAERVVRELEQGCLMLPNGRPLVGRAGVLGSPGKQTSFPGHLVIDRLKHQMQRERREAVSTSHSAQPNTLEYDMAMEWCILQERFDFMYRKLFKQQKDELRAQKAKLKLKCC